MSRPGIALLVLALASAGIGSSARAAEGEDDAEGTPGAAAEPAPAKAAKPVAAHRQERRRRKSKVVGFAVRDADLRAEAPPPPSGHIEIHSLAWDEDVSVDIFNDDGSYDSDALKELDHALRCKRTDTEKPIDPRLFVLLSHVYDHFQKPLQLVSGYRNQRRETSFHFRGSASDIRIAGVAPKKIREFAATLDAGGMGIGLYPRAQFVHIDVRPPPSYRWIDNARPNPNSPDKRPPRGWKRKKLQT
ncbi:MAG TPA: DUF882 domain-containing protein [Polyangia bacterium]|jgi:uncharacterized protein YcbK (DUF882 family)